MKRELITIAGNGIITVPREVRMTVDEIADLFGIFYRTVKQNIRVLEKSGVATGDTSMDGTVEGAKVLPDYYGLEMIIAVAFRVQSAKTEAFRRWVIKKAIRQELTAIPVLLLQNVMLN